MNKGNLFIIAGPSGSGKDTVMSEVLKVKKDLYFSISSITRPMRQGEVEGAKYNFISREKFEELLANDELLEHNEFVGNYYGTPKAPVIENLEKGIDVLIEVDVNGAEKIRKKMPDMISIFIMPPSLEELKRRLSGRGTESPEIVEKRINEALSEIERAKEFDYIVVNDDLKVAVDDILSVIYCAKLTKKNNEHLINQVLGR